MKLKTLLGEEVEVIYSSAYHKDDRSVIVCERHIQSGQLIEDLRHKNTTYVIIGVKAKLILENLHNFPEIITGRINIRECAQLNTLDGSVMKVNLLDCEDCPELTSLSGIGRKYLKEINTLYLTTTITSSVLGLFLVKNLTQLNYNKFENENLATVLIACGNMKGEGKDVLEMKEYLISNGYKEYAKL
jgi:hypothetical protein